MQRLALILSLALPPLWACSGPSTPLCSASNCSGCCDVSGNCHAGYDLQACGSGGNACGSCTFNQQCVAGQCFSTGTGGGTGGGSGGGVGGGAGGGTAGGAGGGTAGGAGGGTAGGAGGGTAGGAGGGAGGGTAVMDVTINQLQSSAVAPSTCVRLSAVVMSTVFGDPDDQSRNDAGVLVPRRAFYVSQKGLSVAQPRSGIEVVAASTSPSPMVSPGDDVTVVGEYVEQFGNSTVRLTPACPSSVVRVGSATMPAPATTTLVAIGQSGGSAGCPPSIPWVDGPSAEDYEGVLVRIGQGQVSAPVDTFGSFEITASSTQLMVHLTPFAVSANPGVGEGVSSLTGFGHFSFCRRRVRPRSSGDLVLNPVP